MVLCLTLKHVGKAFTRSWSVILMKFFNAYHIKDKVCDTLKIKLVNAQWLKSTYFGIEFIWQGFVQFKLQQNGVYWIINFFDFSILSSFSFVVLFFHCLLCTVYILKFGSISLVQRLNKDHVHEEHVHNT